jgi:glycosyltransferase involved in cell wall biosynthesis
MKVYTLVPRLDLNAPVKVASDICFYSKDTFETCIVSVRKSNLEEFRGNKVISLRQLIRNSLKSEKVLVHSHGFYPDLISSLLTSLGFIYSVSTIHSDIRLEMISRYGRIRGLFFFNLWRFLLSRINMVSIVNKSIDSVLNGINTLCVWNGIDVPELHRNEAAISSFNYIRIGCIGRLVDVKGFENLIKFVSDNKNFKLFIAGDGPLKNRYQDLIVRYSVESRVILLGRVTDFKSFYNSIDVMVIPSKSEGFPLVFIEAMSQNIPTVTSDISAFSMLKDYFNFDVFSLDDYSSLNQKILLSLKRPNSYWLSNRSMVLENFSSSEMSKRYVKLYSKLFTL